MIKDLTNKRFGRLVALKPLCIGKDRYVIWQCKCDCGNITTAKSENLLRGSKKSCGCLCREVTIKRLTKHGGGRTRLCNIWHHMKQRCYNETSNYYNNYGGKGITVCDDWKDFAKFRDWALNNGYRDDLTIDRIDNNGNYEPSNCRWVDRKIQANNRRTNKYYEFNGQKYTLPEISIIINIPCRTLYTRIYNHKWDFEKAITTPVRRA